MPTSTPLPVTICELCGATKEPTNSWNPVYGDWTWYYEHTSPNSCIKYLRSLLDNIGSRRIV